MEEMELSIFEMISQGGNAKGLVFEALDFAQKGDLEKADQLLKEADEFLSEAHKVQTNLLHKEAAGDKITITMLFVHAQDHLMTALETRSLADVIISQQRQIQALKERIN